MKPLLLFIILALSITSCKKDDTKACYECDLSYPQATGNYTDAGCYTSDEWNNFKAADIYGNPIDKSKRCRKK